MSKPRDTTRDLERLVAELVGLDLLPSSDEAPRNLSREYAAELLEEHRRRAPLDGLEIAVSCDLVTYWTFGVDVPVAEALKPGFDPEAALEAAYSDGADWGDLNDHAFEHVTVNDHPVDRDAQP